VSHINAKHLQIWDLEQQEEWIEEAKKKGVTLKPADASFIVDGSIAVKILGTPEKGIHTVYEVVVYGSKSTRSIAYYDLKD